MLNRTPLATIQYNTTPGKHIQVFYQDANGDIKALFYDPVLGWNSRTEGERLVGRAKLNTGLAAVSWDNGRQVCGCSFIVRTFRGVKREA